MTKTRDSIPDWIKGVALILMVYGHLHPIGSSASFQADIIRWIYTFHMPLFLIVSGYFHNLEQDAVVSLKAIVRRLFVPYLVFISLYLTGLTLIRITGIPTTNEPPTSFVDALRIILLDPRGAYWFIHTLILIRTSLTLSKLLTDRAKLAEPAYFCITIFLLAALIHFDLINHRPVTYFLIGMAFRHIWGKLPSFPKTGFLLMMATILLLKESALSFSFTQIAWCLSILSFLMGIGSTFKHTTFVTWVSWLGRNSLIVVVLHALFVVGTKPLGHFLVKMDPSGIVFSLLSVITAIFGSLLAGYLSDRVKASSLLFGVNNIYVATPTHRQSARQEPRR